MSRSIGNFEEVLKLEGNIFLFDRKIYDLLSFNKNVTLINEGNINNLVYGKDNTILLDFDKSYKKYWGYFGNIVVGDYTFNFIKSKKVNFEYENYVNFFNITRNDIFPNKVPIYKIYSTNDQTLLPLNFYIDMVNYLKNNYGYLDFKNIFIKDYGNTAIQLIHLLKGNDSKFMYEEKNEKKLYCLEENIKLFDYEDEIDTFDDKTIVFIKDTNEIGKYYNEKTRLIIVNTNKFDTINYKYDKYRDFAFILVENKKIVNKDKYFRLNRKLSLDILSFEKTLNLLTVSKIENVFEIKLYKNYFEIIPKHNHITKRGKKRLFYIPTNVKESIISIKEIIGENSSVIIDGSDTIIVEFDTIYDFNNEFVNLLKPIDKKRKDYFIYNNKPINLWIEGEIDNTIVNEYLDIDNSYFIPKNLIEKEIIRRDLYKDLKNELFNIMKIEDCSGILLRYIFNKIYDRKTFDDPVFIETRSKTAEKQLEKDLLYFNVNVDKNVIIDMIEDHFNKANEILKGYIDNDEYVNYNNGILEYKDSKFNDISNLVENNPEFVNYSIALQIRYDYLELGNQGLANIYSDMGKLPNDDVLEGFATSFNRYFNNYCSAFPDLEYVFGSLGSFFDVIDSTDIKYVFCNSPFDESLMENMINKIISILDKKEKTFVCTFPYWKDFKVMTSLKNNKYCKEFKVINKCDTKFKDHMKNKMITPCNICEVILSNSK